ncbi:arginase family protein [Actinoplanes subglobosus]|uniref:Arginase family protein n=1 Tax=Actinoplanes subglobosus TaxID=1547892 RepID=A0ABV8J941_9ACTN
MTIILVPYHQDDQLPAGDIVAPADVIVHPEFPAGDRWERLATQYEAVATAVAAADGLPLVFSGDCLIAGGVVAGVQRRGDDPAMVWFDAHADLHTFESSGSGYLGGMSLRLVTGAHPGEYADRFGLRPVASGRVVLADARDVDPPEADYLAGSAVRRVPVAAVTAETAPDGPLVVHVDLDVIDPAEVPRLRFPVAGGPAAADVLAACERLLATGRVVAVHVACPWWPAAGDGERATREALVARFTALVSPAGRR